MPQSAWARLPVTLAFAALVGLPAAAQGEDDGDLELGREVFVEIAEPQCGLCHTLADAGATGELAPSLDQLQPSRERVEQVVREGIGIMPPFGDTLSEEEIKAVAHYVATVAGQP